MKEFYFVHPNKFFVSFSDEHSFLKKFTETDLGKCISFILVKNILDQNPNKKMFRKNFLTFCMFFKFKGSIFRFFFPLFLSFFKQRYKIEDDDHFC